MTFDVISNVINIIISFRILSYIILFYIACDKHEVLCYNHKMHNSFINHHTMTRVLIDAA